jgi:hypothetical protein
VQTLDGLANMARCEAGGVRDPCYTAQLTILQAMYAKNAFDIAPF